MTNDSSAKTFVEWRERLLLLDPTPVNARLLQDEYDRMGPQPTRNEHVVANTMDARALDEGLDRDLAINGVQVDKFVDAPPPVIKAGRVMRIEVVDSEGRAFYGVYDSSGVELHLQDEDSTLKIFAGTRGFIE